MKLLWLAVYFATLIWSAINPHDHFTWFLEVAPALVGLIILALTYKHFPLTPLAYTLILIHCLILFIGAHYTYAQVERLNSSATFSAGREITTISSATLPRASYRRSLRARNFASKFGREWPELA